jgi:hypothetical protein
MEWRTVGNFRIAGGHVIFLVENGLQLLRSNYISKREPSLRKQTNFFKKKNSAKITCGGPEPHFSKKLFC